MKYKLYMVNKRSEYLKIEMIRISIIDISIRARLRYGNFKESNKYRLNEEK